MSNNYDEPILLDSGVGTPAAPGDYFGFGRTATGVVSTGPRVYGGTGDPSNVLTAPAGSLYLSSTGSAGGGGTLFVNTDGASTWVLTSATT